MHAVATLAGEPGTRTLPWSRGLRKEFLPLNDRAEHRRNPVLKPVADLVVEALAAAG